MAARLRRLRLTLEAWAIRSRDWFLTAVRAVAIGLVVLGAYNLLVAPFVGEAYLTVYRSLFPARYAAENAVYSLADVLLMAVGAAIAWFT